MAYICKYIAKFGGRTIVLSHVKELIAQTEETLRKLDDSLDVGVYSAGLNRYDTDNQIICAGIQSAFNKVDRIGNIHVAIIDEAHLIPRDENSRYRKFLNEMREKNPALKLVGLTATPYRTDDGLIYGEGELFSGVTYKADIDDLIQQGYLSPIRSKTGSAEVDVSQLTRKGNDYDIDELTKAFSDEAILHAAISDIVTRAEDRKKILVFAPSIAVCTKFARIYELLVDGNVRVATGNDTNFYRDETVKLFKEGDLRTLVNCAMYTTGFDAPNVDCVILLRATLSPSLYCQMVGRGFRLADGKKDCLILDYGKNIQRHGPVNHVEVTKKRRGETSMTKECPQCKEVVSRVAIMCPDCGFVFPKEEVERHLKIETTAAQDEILAQKYEYEVEKMTFTDAIKTDKGFYVYALYYVTGKRRPIKEFLGIGYAGYCLKKTTDWIKQHVSDDVWKEYGYMLFNPDYTLNLVGFQTFVKYNAFATPERIICKYEKDSEGREWLNVKKAIIGYKPSLEDVNEEYSKIKEREQNNAYGYGSDSYSAGNGYYGGY